MVACFFLKMKSNPEQTEVCKKMRGIEEKNFRYHLYLAMYFWPFHMKRLVLFWFKTFLSGWWKFSNSPSGAFNT